MTRGTQLWPGEKMRMFFRAHIRRETTLDDAAVERLSEALSRVVNRMLVWEQPEEPAIAPSFRSKLASQSSPVTPSAAQFNPYLFSAMAVLAKNGRDGLAKRLTEIKSAEHLKAFAEAQHLAIDGTLKKLEDLRRAIIAAAEQRLADRKAAAS